ncbi:Isopenicillin N synthase-like superfamily protein [Abortiporus biennis]
MSLPTLGPCPPRFVEIKRDIEASYPDFKERVTKAWVDLLDELAKATKDIVEKGQLSIPQVEFTDVATGNLSPETLEDIRKKGCVVIKNVVDDAEASTWKDDLREYVTKNPVLGDPPEDKQFFQLYWTRSQVRARSHPNVLETQAWLNKLYHVKGQKQLNEVDLSVPLSYADRFRMRHPGNQWNAHPPHVDGGAIERWEDKTFRTCFEDILTGNWRQHDPYDLEGRINARSSMYGRQNQASIFRTYQGWLAMSETAPHEGTLKVFPNVILSNAYMILRPFFRPISTNEANFLDAKNWEYDISDPDFPGIYSRDGGFAGPRPETQTHPHLRLEETMISVPKVYPGDMVYWHCDVVHAVEVEHLGNDDSCVMYIPAVPHTPQNAEYISRQKESFLKGIPPPDFPKWEGETSFVGRANVEDIISPIGKRAMGFAVEVV